MDSVIESMKAKGFTYLGIVEGEKIFCNLDSEESIKNCLEFLKKLTGEEWETLKEESGNENLVFYRTSMFEQFAYLHFKGGNKIELPLNCSSCFSMFEDCNLSVDLFIDNEFDTSKVEDMNFMFLNCKLPKGFSLGDKFDVSSVEDMSYMFQNCKLPEDFSLGDKFDTSSVKDMSFMFQNCRLPEDFSLGDKFNTSSVKNMHNMFYECVLPEGKTRKDFNSELEIIEWLNSRSKQSTDKQGTEKLSAF